MYARSRLSTRPPSLLQPLLISALCIDDVPRPSLPAGNGGAVKTDCNRYCSNGYETGDWCAACRHRSATAVFSLCLARCLLNHETCACAPKLELLHHVGALMCVAFKKSIPDVISMTRCAAATVRLCKRADSGASLSVVSNELCL